MKGHDDEPYRALALLRGQMNRELVAFYGGDEAFAETFEIAVDRVRELEAGAWPTPVEWFLLIAAEDRRDREEGCAADPLICKLRQLTLSRTPFTFRTREEAVAAFEKLVADVRQELGLERVQ